MKFPKLFQLKGITSRRWRVFFRQTRAKIGMTVFFILFFFSMTAEFWSNHEPLLLIRDVPVEGAGGQQSSGTERKWFFPALHQYAASDFGIEDAFVVDYKQLVEQDKQAGKKTVAIFPPNSWDPYIQTANVLTGPSKDHWLGTDSLGRDVSARLLYGIRVSLSYGLLYWVFSFLIGIFIGAIQGYFASWVDFVVERVKELAEIIPFLSVVILVNGLAKSQSFFVTLFVVVAFAWITISSQVRAQFLSLRKRDFCEAPVAAGSKHGRIIFKHILPNALAPVLTLTPFAVSSGIATLAVLDYLGFGLNPPTPSLGELLAQGRVYIINASWLLIAPTVALVLMLISINLIGEALRQAFDPRKG